MLHSILMASAIFLLSINARAQESETFIYDGFNFYLEVNIANAFGGEAPRVENLQINYVPFPGASLFRNQEHVRSGNITSVEHFGPGNEAVPVVGWTGTGGSWKGVEYKYRAYRRIEIHTDSKQFHKIVIYAFPNENKRSEVWVYTDRGLFIGRRNLGVHALRCGAAFLPPQPAATL